MVSKFCKGDLVKWCYSEPHLPYTITATEQNRFNDIGIVLNIEVWEDDSDTREVIEVYFAKAGPNWCNPRSLEVVSKY